MKLQRTFAIAALPCVVFCASGLAQTAAAQQASRIDTVQITATRFGEPVQEVPVSMTVITHEELVARGANDLRTALALMAGTGVAPGGDSGPAGAVPGLLGLREADDFLLLVDDVPAGGAFTPPFETVSLNNVERIEVLRGSAPVYFGTTAFAGTINIVHYRAGSAAPDLMLSVGSRGSASMSGAQVLSSGAVRQSLAAELSHDQFSDRRAGYNRAQANYRLATAVLDGEFRFDLNLQSLRQRPGSPTPVGDDGRLIDTVPADFNQNPGDAHLNTQRGQLVLGYDVLLPIGRWGSTLSYTHTRIENVQGFLLDGGLDQPAGDNAQGARQSRGLHDLFFDTHVTTRPAAWLDLTYGLNELYGRARQASDSFTYRVSPDGSRPETLEDGTPTDTEGLSDRRSFLGVYAQSRARLSDDVSLLAGLRLNHTAETRRTTEDGASALVQTQRTTRLNGSLGALWEVWRDKSGDLDDVSLYGNLGDTFQPPQLDFGPDAGADPLLRPETQRSLSFGIKADGDDGRFDIDLGTFFVDFANQAVTGQVDGTPVLQSGGTERYQGFEIEASFRPAPAWTLSANFSDGTARYRAYTTVVGDTLTALDGRFLPLTPRLRTGAALVYAPGRGLGFSLTANYSGPRYLDAPNQDRAPGFTTVDASLAWRFDRVTLSLTGTNLTNRRDPVLPSELGEGQVYRMPARQVFASIALPIR